MFDGKSVRNDPEGSVTIPITDFNHLLKEGKNTGIFVVADVEYVHFETRNNLQQDVLNLILTDVNVKFAQFSCYGNTAEIWKNVKIGDVIQVYDFEWREKPTTKMHYHPLLNTNYEGIITGETNYEGLRSGLGQKWIPNYKKLFVMEEVKLHPSHFVAKLANIDPIKGYENERGKGEYKVYHFLTVDDQNVRITFFNETIVEHKLENNKVYEVIGASYKEQAPNRFTDLNLTGHNLMKFEKVTNIPQPIMESLTFDQIIENNFERNGVYETVVRARTGTSPIKFHPGFYQFQAVDGSRFNDMPLCAIAQSSEQKIMRGQLLKIQYSIKREGEHQILKVTHVENCEAIEEEVAPLTYEDPTFI